MKFCPQFFQLRYGTMCIRTKQRSQSDSTERMSLTRYPIAMCTAHNLPTILRKRKRKSDISESNRHSVPRLHSAMSPTLREVWAKQRAFITTCWSSSELSRTESMSDKIAPRRRQRDMATMRQMARTPRW